MWIIVKHWIESHLLNNAISKKKSQDKKRMARQKIMTKQDDKTYEKERYKEITFF